MSDSQQQKPQDLLLKVSVGSNHDPVAIYGTAAALAYLEQVLAEANARIREGGALGKAVSTPGGKIAAVSDQDFMCPESGEAFGVLVIVQPNKGWAYWDVNTSAGNAGNHET